MPDSRFFPKPDSITLEAICALTGAKAIRADGSPASGSSAYSNIAPLDQADSGMVSFFDNTKYLSMFCDSKAGACFVKDKFRDRAPKDMVLLVTDEPYYAYAQLATALYPETPAATVISPAAHIDTTAKIGKNVSIGPGAVISAGAEIGDHSSIGANSVIGENVVLGAHCRVGALCSITHAVLGSHVILHRGVQIGQDGFGFAPSPRGVLKVPQLGRVMIGDHVDIGSNSCIDRGAGPDTTIGAHTKIDNLVQIAHNVQIGKYVFIAAQVGIAGSTKVGDFAMLGGQVGLSGHVNIGAGAKLIAQSGVMHDLEGGATYGGSPAVPARDWHRQTLALAKLSRKSPQEA